jgi:hypothetical protein
MDPLWAGLFLFTCFLWGVAGYSVCTARHKQRGLEQDPWSHVLPPLPPGTQIPDTPPHSPAGAPESDREGSNL